MPIGNEMNGLQSQQKPHELQLVGLSVPFGQGGLNLRLAASYHNLVYTAPGRKASDCVKCGKCEKVCLQHLQIRNLLEDVVKEFEAERA